MKVEALDTDLGVEEEEKEIYFNLRLQYARKIIMIQVSYRV